MTRVQMGEREQKLFLLLSMTLSCFSITQVPKGHSSSDIREARIIGSSKRQVKRHVLVVVTLRSNRGMDHKILGFNVFALNRILGQTL